MSSRRATKAKLILVFAGLSLLIVSVGADWIGIGDTPGFGKRQVAMLLVSLSPLVIGGGWVLAGWLQAGSTSLPRATRDSKLAHTIVMEKTPTGTTQGTAWLRMRFPSESSIYFRQRSAESFLNWQRLVHANNKQQYVQMGRESRVPTRRMGMTGTNLSVWRRIWDGELTFAHVIARYRRSSCSLLSIGLSLL